MHNSIQLEEDFYYVGASDSRIQRFENMFPLDNGVAYNSYLYLDEKTCLLDTVDNAITDIYLENVKHVLNGRGLDYLVINHMEPDHCANIDTICQLYPTVKLVGNKKTFELFEQFYTTEFRDRYHLVNNEDTLSLGKRELKFIFAPMVHWPEVMFTYEKTSATLFSADAFGSFGKLMGAVFSDELNFDELYLQEARRYYINIVGKHGRQVQNTFKKLEGLEIKMICALHGPIYRNKQHIDLMLSKYQTWSSFQVEEAGVVFVYASMYGNTENVVNHLATMLAAKGVKNIRMYDVSDTDTSFIIADMHRFSHTVFGLLTYNTELYHNMQNLIECAVGTGFSGRKVSYLVNQSWGGKALPIAQEILAKAKDIETIGEPLYIKSSLKEEQLPELAALADAIYSSYQQ